MIDGLVKLIDWLWEKFSEHLWPVIVIRDYEAGMRLRLGRRIGRLKTGVNWKWPLIDEIHTCLTKPDTFHVSNATVTTADGKTAAFGTIVEYQIVDPEKYLLDYNEALSNMHDFARGSVAQQLMDCTWEECKQRKTWTKIKNKLKEECEPMGIEIIQIQFGDITQVRALTIFNKQE